MISDKDIAKLRRLLVKDSRSLERQIKKLKKRVDFGNDVDGGEEESDETEELGVNTATARMLEERLTNILDSIRKIDGGKYGKCKKCGGDIDLELLKIVPESDLCRNCKLSR